MITKQKLFLSCLILSFFVQIGFSFYYNSQIIDQNKLLQQQQLDQRQLLTVNQSFTYKLAQLTSLKHLFPLIKSKNLQPVNQTLSIPQN